MDRAISDHGIRVLGAVAKATDLKDRPLVWVLIEEEKYEQATKLLQFAKDNRFLKTFRSGNDDLLRRSIDHRSEECVKFILDKLVDRFTSLEETCDLLNLHFRKLVQTYPDLMWDYLHKDRFTFEYARLKITKRPIRNKRGYLAGLFSDCRLRDWKTVNVVTAIRHWLPIIGEGRTDRSSFGRIRLSTLPPA